MQLVRLKFNMQKNRSFHTVSKRRGNRRQKLFQIYQVDSIALPGRAKQDEVGFGISGIKGY
jgi:hypothetical protein